MEIQGLESLLARKDMAVDVKTLYGKRLGDISMAQLITAAGTTEAKPDDGLISGAEVMPTGRRMTLERIDQADDFI